MKWVQSWAHTHTLLHYLCPTTCAEQGTQPTPCCNNCAPHSCWKYLLVWQCHVVSITSAEAAMHHMALQSFQHEREAVLQEHPTGP